MAYTPLSVQGHTVMRRGGGGIDAVAAAISVLEDCELTNAGRGSNLSRSG